MAYRLSWCSGLSRKSWCDARRGEWVEGSRAFAISLPPLRQLGRSTGNLKSMEEFESDQAYFQAVEKIFVELRGAPLLVSPADWHVASRWHQEGVPLALVKRALEEVFAKRKERGTKGRISSLRYCAPAVEAAWADLRELTAPGERAEAAPLDIAARLRNLAAAVPDAFKERVLAL